MFDQLVPFQRCTETMPTATQLVAVEHDTAKTAVLGLFTLDHFLPFQRCVNPLPTAPLPTARQLVAVEHDTLVGVASVAVPTIADQLVPFQCARKACWKPAAPTATQLVAFAHDTLERKLSELANFGIALIDQLLPFHRSMSV
jgi:hypothetical protein